MQITESFLSLSYEEILCSPGNHNRRQTPVKKKPRWKNGHDIIEKNKTNSDK